MLVMAMECFVVQDQLLVNELAPRVHNSGHWTQLVVRLANLNYIFCALLDLPYA